jgi:pimeloyl-ACP methyl ester carboxylesterase
MELIRHHAPRRPGERPLLVMLPGVGMEAGDFARQGFVRAVAEAGDAADVVATRPETDLYLDGSIAEALERSVVAPAREAGYRRLWFLGISLGGMGALLHARAHPAAAEGIILLSPFLGTPGLVAEVTAASGLAAWHPGEVAAHDSERQLLAWLKGHLASRAPRPALYLGYGLSDRFARGHAMLADGLPAERVVRSEGGHDWPTWCALWREILAFRPFAAQP